MLEGLLFFTAPGGAVVAAGCIVFFAMMQINGLMAVILGVLTMLMYTKAHPSAWSAIVLPLALLPGSPIAAVGFLIFLFAVGHSINLFLEILKYLFTRIFCSRIDISDYMKLIYYYCSV